MGNRPLEFESLVYISFCSTPVTAKALKQIQRKISKYQSLTFRNSQSKRIQSEHLQ
jgi:hypothetical protein